MTTYPNHDDYDERGPEAGGVNQAVPAPFADGAIEQESVGRAAKDSRRWGQYIEEVDRESARETLGGRLTDAAAADAPAHLSRPRKPAQPKGRGRRDDNPRVGYLKSRVGRSMINTIARGVFGLLRKRR